MASLPSLFKHEDNKRARLNFAGVEAACPELAERVRLIRGRIKDLEGTFGQDADWALTRFNHMTCLAMAIGGLGVAIVLAAVWLNIGTMTATLAVMVGTIVALVAAGSQAFGYHKRFGAMFAARWAVTALATQMDRKIVQLAIDAQASRTLTDQARTELEANIDHWVAELGKVMSGFGTAYATAIEPIAMPQISNLAG